MLGSVRQRLLDDTVEGGFHLCRQRLIVEADGLIVNLQPRPAGELLNMPLGRGGDKTQVVQDCGAQFKGKASQFL